MVERLVANEKVVGSSPIARSKIMYRYLIILFQRFLDKNDIRKYKNSIFYYLFYRLVRNKLKNDLKIKIYNFYIWASYKKNKQSHSILRKCDFEDLPEIKLIDALFSKKKILLFDCGANFGFYSLFVSSMSKSNKIYSFEASPSTYLDFKRNITLNNYNNIRSFNLAISDKTGLEIELVESKNDWESSISNTNFEITNKIKIKTKILDDFVEENLECFSDFITIIKLDIEGHEMYALNGASRFIKKFSPLIIIEFSKFISDRDYKIMENFILENNYVIYDSKYNKIDLNIVKKRLKELPNSMYGIGNNFLIKKKLRS